MKRFDTEPARRGTAIVLQWGGWLTTIGVFIYATLEFDPNHGNFAPQWVPFAFILSMGIAIAGTLVRSRMRLTDTIMNAFKAGARIRAEQEANQAARESSASIREEAQVQREANQVKRDKDKRKD